MSSAVASWMTSVRPYLRSKRPCRAAMRLWYIGNGYHQDAGTNRSHRLGTDFDEALRGDPGFINRQDVARIVQADAVVEGERLLLDR